MKFIEIKNVGFDNKGAELMLQSICKEFSTYQLVVTPNSRLEYKDFSKLGIFMRLAIPRSSFITLEVFLRFLPARIRHRIGVANWKEIDTVLDCSGLGYADSWGLKDARDTLDLFRKAKRDKKKIIMLPQAFGPFKDPELFDTMKEIFALSDVVYVRDEVSMAHCRDTGDANFIMAEDFTNTYHDNKIESRAKSKRMLFVPNYRLLDKGGLSKAQFYDLTLAAKKTAEDCGLEFKVLFHEEADQKKLADRYDDLGVDNVFSDNIEVLASEIAASTCIVTGRYHAAATALSLGVPTLALSWSHKYAALLGIYEQERFVSNGKDLFEFEELVRDLIKCADSKPYLQKMEKHSIKYKRRTRSFFDELDKRLA